MTSDVTTPMATADRRLLAAVLIVALLVRLPLTAIESVHHADEIWQYVEPAYRLDFGRAIVPWEYRAGVRSWLVPMMLGPPVWLGERLSLSAPLLPVRLMLAVFSLPIVWAGFVIGRRISRLHAVLAASVLAIGFEPIFMAVRPLSEAIGTVPLVAAAALLTAPRASARACTVGGALLGLAVAVRLQLAPAAATLALLCSARDARKFRGVVIGGAAGLLVDAAANLAMGAPPFYWMIENYRFNLIEHISDRYGTRPPGWYVSQMIGMGGPTLPLVAVLVAVGARRQPILVIVALVHLAIHSLIPHKEFRFVFPSIVLLMLVGGLGSADIVEAAAARGRRWRWAAIGVVVMGWIGCLASGAVFSVHNHRLAGFAKIAMWRTAHAAPGLCGLASLRQGPIAMAYSYVDRPVPIYMFTEHDAERVAVLHARAFNMIDAGKSFAPVLARGGLRLRQCFSSPLPDVPGEPLEHCLFVRAGGCDPRGSEPFLENAVRERLDF